jgi:hypothetical protein
MAHRFFSGQAPKASGMAGVLYAEGLVGPTNVVDADPLSNDARGVLLSLEAMTVYAPLLPGPDDALDDSVLLRAVRGDELLPEP